MPSVWNLENLLVIGIFFMWWKFIVEKMMLWLTISLVQVN